jgi:uncharacterized protein VirK/YbjX
MEKLHSIFQRKLVCSDTENQLRDNGDNWADMRWTHLFKFGKSSISEYQQQMSQAPQMSSFQQQPPVMSQQMMFMQERFQQNMHDTIHHALSVNSPEANEGDTLQVLIESS